MTWNYRLVYRKDVKVTPGARMGVYAIHEAYYEDDKKPSVVTTITEDAIGVYGETIDEAWAAYQQMSEAFAKPVLDYKTRQPLRQPTKKIKSRRKK